MKKEYYDFPYSGDQIKALLEKIDKELEINKFGYVEVNNTDNKLYFYTDSSKSKLVASVALPIPEIIDNLNTTDKDKTLSANQGKILKDLVDKKQSDFTKIKHAQEARGIEI